MSIVCSICGGTGVKCTAVIDPNTRQFLEFTRNALSDGRCSQCGNVALTDPDEVKAGLDKLWTEYTARHRAAPNYTCCDIVRHGDYDGCEKAYIRIGGPSDVVEKYPVVAVCRDLEELKSLALPDPTREFTLMGIQGFKFHDVLENKTYEIGVDDLKIPVTTKEVLDFYPAEHRLKETDIEQYAAAYTARIKAYREYTRQLDATLVRRLLDKERLMKVGESDGFRLKLHFDWFVILKRENERMYAPFKCKYSINSLVYWVTYVHNVVYSFYRSMIYCYINSTQRCAGSIEIDIIPTNGADKRKFSPFAPYFPVTNVIKRYFYPYFPAIIGIKGYSFPYFPYLSGIMKIKTALYSLFSRLDWHKTVVFPCLGEIYEGIRSLSWEIPVT